MLLALGAIWGASFLLIKIALRDLPPTSVIAFRILLGLTTLVLLLPFLPERGRALGDLRARWRALAIVGATNTAFPFFLITWGQQYIDTSIAAIFNASAPLWTAWLAVASEGDTTPMTPGE